MRNKILPVASMLLALVAGGCERPVDEVTIDEIGCAEEEIHLGYASGSTRVEILSNGKYEASLPEGADWIHFPGGMSFAGEGDGYLTLEWETNRSIPRTTTLTLARGNHTARVPIVQDGLLDGGAALDKKSVVVPAEGGLSRVRLLTLLDPSAFSVSVTYDDGEGWLSHAVIDAGALEFQVQPHVDGEDIRHARILVSFEDRLLTLLVAQFPLSLETTPVTIAQLKSMTGGSDSWTVPRHYLLEGQVINEFRHANGAENRNVSSETPDRQYKDRMAYLQDEDGLSGLKLLFTESCDAMVDPYSKVGIDLYGLTVTHESNPDRYSISGIPVNAILSSEGGIAPTPRSKTIGDLTAEDLFTLVTLKNVEIPFRKGPYVPLDLRYLSVVTSCIMPLRDIEGGSIPMMVNVDCDWARSGSPMPSGSGDVTGVLVCERGDNYEWDTAEEQAQKAAGIYADYITGTGDIGPWQIRPMLESDIDIAQSMDEGFSGLLYEWRYCDSLGVNLVRNYSRKEMALYPTWPSSTAPEDLDASFYCIGSDAQRKDFGLCNDFTHLGPYVYGGTITEPSNGNGVFDALGRSAHWNVWATVSTIGVIYSGADWETSNGSAWQVSGWSTGQYWCAEFPTSELDAGNAPLSVQFGTMGCINGPGAPRFWSLEYSLDGSTWTKAGSYTVPDFPRSGLGKVWQLPGTKYLSFNLPDSLLGRDKVLVRLIPASSAAGTASEYAGASSITASRYNAINYFAVRYNKKH